MRNSEDIFCNANLKQKSYAQLYAQQQKGLLCDYFLQVAEEKIPVHRIVLASVIPFFRNVFTMDDQACQAAIKKALMGLSPKVLKDIIAYAYTGQLLVNSAHVDHLLTATRTFQLSNLSTYVETYIFKRLSTENISSVWSYAKKMDLKAVSDACLVAVRNHFDEFLESNFLETMPLSLLKEFLSSDYLHVDNEDSVFKALDWWTQKQQTKDEEARKALLEQLLPLLRLSRLSKEFCHNLVLTHPICKASAVCRRLLESAAEKKNEPPRIYKRDTSTEHVFVLLQETPDYIIMGDNDDSTRVLKLYDIEANTFTNLANLEYLFLCEVVGAGSDIYVLGGDFDDSEDRHWCRVSAITRKTTKLQTMNHFSSTSLFLVVKGIIVKFACYGGNVESYNPKSNSWSTCPSMVNKRTDYSLCNVDDSYLLVIGGLDTDEKPTASIDIMRLTDNVDEFRPTFGWQSDLMPALLQPRCRHRSEFWRGRLFVVGGEVEGVRDFSVEMFTSEQDPITTWKSGKWIPKGQWTRVQKLHYFQDIQHMFIYKEALYAVGNENLTSTSYVCRLKASTRDNRAREESDSHNDELMLNRGAPFPEFNYEQWEWELVTTYTGTDFLEAFGVVNIPVTHA